MEWTIASVVMGVDTTAMMTVGVWMFPQMQALSNDVRQEIQDLRAVLQNHTHEEEGRAIFHRLTASNG